MEAADRSGNLLDIFHWAWRYAGYLYNRYPFLDPRLDADGYSRQVAGIARGALERSVAHAEQARTGMGARGATLMEQLVYQYYAAVDIEARTGKPEKAFAYSEGLRSRGFLEQMGAEAALRLPSVGPGEAARVRALTGEIGNLRELLAKLNPQQDPQSYAGAGARLNAAEAELAALDAELAAKAPRYGELRSPRLVTAEEALRFCGTDTAVLEYVLWDSSVPFTAPATQYGQSSYRERPSVNSYCLVVTGEGVIPVRLDPAFDYAGAVNGLRGLIKSLAPLQDLEPYRNSLYAALIGPVMPHIPQSATRLLIVPDGALAHLPFDLLRENGNGPELGDRFRASFSPSVSVGVLAAKGEEMGNEPLLAFGGAWYAKDKSAADRGGRAVGFPEPGEASGGIGTVSSGPRWRDLPGTEAEVRELGKLGYGGEGPTVFLGKDASEAKVKELSPDGALKGYPPVHFACHGYFDGNDAATVEFMKGVYRRVIEGGVGFGEAYYEEKREFRQRGDEWEHPYYWAAFMLYE